ncbi:MAG: pilin [Patescibacteria group bacterium]|nr:pilin [Patescibacteria group bacterium]
MKKLIKIFYVLAIILQFSFAVQSVSADAGNCDCRESLDQDAYTACLTKPSPNNCLDYSNTSRGLCENADCEWVPSASSGDCSTGANQCTSVCPQSTTAPSATTCCNNTSPTYCSSFPSAYPNCTSGCTGYCNNAGDAVSCAFYQSANGGQTSVTTGVCECNGSLSCNQTQSNCTSMSSTGGVTCSWTADANPADNSLGVCDCNGSVSCNQSHENCDSMSSTGGVTCSWTANGSAAASAGNLPPAASAGNQPATPSVNLTNPLGNINSVPALIGNIINAALGVVGSLALIMFIYGGFTWMLAAGNEQAVEKGRNILVWAAVGLIVIFASYSLVNFVINAITKGG